MEAFLPPNGDAEPPISPSSPFHRGVGHSLLPSPAFFLTSVPLRAGAGCTHHHTLIPATGCMPGAPPIIPESWRDRSRSHPPACGFPVPSYPSSTSSDFLKPPWPPASRLMPNITSVSGRVIKLREQGPIARRQVECRPSTCQPASRSANVTPGRPHRRGSLRAASRRSDPWRRR